MGWIYKILVTVFGFTVLLCGGIPALLRIGLVILTV